MKKILLLLILLITSSCSSTAIIDEPFNVTKKTIDKYFNEESNIYVGEGDKKKRVSFSTKYTEVLKDKESTWVHQLGSPTDKNNLFNPTFLTVTLQKEDSQKSKITVDVIKEKLTFNERLKTKQEAYLRMLRGYIKMNKENHNQQVD